MFNNYEDFYDEVNDAIEESLGSKVTEDKKLELIESLYILYQTQKREILNQIKTENSAVYNFQSNNLQYVNNQNPYINLYLIQSPNIQPYVPNFGYPQQQQMNPLTPNPYISNYQSFQYPISLPNYNPQPNLYPYTQQFIPNSNQPIKIKNTDKKKKDKNKEKSRKKSKSTKKDAKTKKILKFTHIEGQEFQGIIHYLTEKTGGNIHLNQTINLTSTFPDFNTYPYFLLDQNKDYHFNPNDVITYDFKNMEVEISSYTVKSMNNPVGHIKNWVIEISNDEKSWSEIDKHTDDPTMNSPGKIATFKVNNSRFARYVRFRHTGPFWKSLTGIMACSIRINSIEFYGRLKIHKK